MTQYFIYVYEDCVSQETVIYGPNILICDHGRASAVEGKEDSKEYSSQRSTVGSTSTTLARFGQRQGGHFSTTEELQISNISLLILV